MRIVTLSDTHTYHDKVNVPDGDVLIHAGDFTMRGDEAETLQFAKWLGRQPHKHKLVTPGNHDWACERLLGHAQTMFKAWGADLVVDDLREINGHRFYLSPWVPKYYNWAFMKPRAEMNTIWERLPEDIQVLITHGPARGILDSTLRGEQVGDDYLSQWVEKNKPALHIFGHIHEGYGELILRGTRSINTSICNVQYNPVNKPFVIDI